MRFLVASLVALLATAQLVSADLRQASSPRSKYKVNSRNNAVKFVPTTALYLEPSTFNYAGLKQQRDGGAYDNFLRSNIDNEQDKRNFRTEDGKDHLPFRTMEGAAYDRVLTGAVAASQVDNSAGATHLDSAGTPPGVSMQVKVGSPYTVPLRWNNPHASELEVNAWLMPKSFGGATTAIPVVVPLRKPTCSGEGYQDDVFQYTIPESFLNLGASVPGFTGCKAVGDCVLQIYAHSVETRQYSMGTPLIVLNKDGSAPTWPTPTATAAVRGPDIEVGTDVASLTHETCLPSSSNTADIPTPTPRLARLVSDQFNHAYQNSDYSPYAGQQPLDISKNLQAAAVLRMTVGNRGELGRSVLAQNKTRQNMQQNLQNRFETLYKRYEGITNNIIAKLEKLPGADKVSSTDTSMIPADGQKTETCFRCGEVGATNTQRLTTTTYIPSFPLTSAAAIAAAKAQLPAGGKYDNLISNTNPPTVQIYMATLADMTPELVKAGQWYDLKYLPAVIKNTLTTMSDITKFKKIDLSPAALAKNPNGVPDNGQYATIQAANAIKAANIAADKQVVKPGATISPMAEYLKADVDTSIQPLAALPALNSDQSPAANQKDMDAMNYDEPCEAEETWDQPCGVARTMFTVDADGNEVLAANAASSLSSSSSVIALFAAAAAAIVHFRA